MGVIGRILAPGAIAAAGEAAKGVAEVFVPSATRRMELSAEAQQAALQQFGVEFEGASAGWFDRLVNGLNRLPRPLLAFGTIGMFVYAMIDPVEFGHRMSGLNAVPEPLWWLLGAIVAFYFGARETHYFRSRGTVAAPGAAPPAREGEGNAALEAWRAEG
jgi:hypothetical protein